MLRSGETTVLFCICTIPNTTKFYSIIQFYVYKFRRNSDLTYLADSKFSKVKPMFHLVSKKKKADKSAHRCRETGAIINMSHDLKKKQTYHLFPDKKLQDCIWTDENNNLREFGNSTKRFFSCHVKLKTGTQSVLKTNK